MKQGTVIWSSGCFKGPLKISNHEFKVCMIECFPSSSFSIKGAGTQSVQCWEGPDCGFAKSYSYSERGRELKIYAGDDYTDRPLTISTSNFLNQIGKY